MIQLQNAGLFSNGRKLLQDLDLHVAQGELLVLCGASGSGKSTLLKMLNRLIPELYPGQPQGEIRVLGQALTAQPFHEYVTQLGVVFQNPKTQFFTSDVYSELAFSLENNGWPQGQIQERIREVTQLLQLEALLDKTMFQLSGGQKQLIACASAYMLGQPLFLLDEPSSNLDAQTIQQLQQYLTLLKKQGTTIVIAEHRLHYLTELADHYLLLENGRSANYFSRAEMLKKTAAEVKQLGLRSLKPVAISAFQKTPSPADDYYLLKCCGLSYAYRKQPNAVAQIDVTLSSQYITGIVGPNGAGKSTFSNLLAGLLKPTAGYIEADGKRLSHKQRLKDSYVVLQDVNLQLFFETVEKEITAKVADLTKVPAVVQLLELQPLLQRHPQTLSGGEKQRVAIAAALVSGKKYLILDEPTSGLDLKQMLNVSQTIRKLQLQNVLVVIISHDQEFLQQTCQRILHFEAGSLSSDQLI